MIELYTLVSLLHGNVLGVCVVARISITILQRGKSLNDEPIVYLVIAMHNQGVRKIIGGIDVCRFCYTPKVVFC